MRTLRIGYVPLTDCAVLVAAAEKGFARAEGLHLELERESSWASCRDKLVFGRLDAAHFLAPLAIATSIGLGHVRAPLLAPFALSLNGNAITVTADLARAVRDRAPGAAGVPALAAALGAAVRARAQAGLPPPTFATTFPVSTHTYQLHLLLAAAGLQPDRDVRIVVVPPPLMVDAMRGGLVDGFCVGSPWNSVAVGDGIGRILVFGSDLVPRCPEKVLAWPAKAEDSPDLAPLIRALTGAAAWCAEPAHREDLAALLGGERYLGLDPALLARSLAGDLVLDPEGRVRSDPAYLLLGGAGVNRPEEDHARWLIGHMKQAGHCPPTLATETAAKVYRPDLYDAAFVPGDLSAS